MEVDSTHSRIKTTRILVVDDHSVVRRGVRSMLAGNRRWQICGEAADGAESVQKARELKPDLVIMDITMSGVSGLEATRHIISSSPKTRVLVFTMHESEQVVTEVLQAGAHGYVLKSDADTDLLAAVEALAQGGSYFTGKVATMMTAGFLHPGTRNTSHPTLTGRQREVMRLLAGGKANKEVAADLGISIKTVEVHRKDIMRKLKFGSFSDLVRYAIREHIIES